MQNNLTNLCVVFFPYLHCCYLCETVRLKEGQGLALWLGRCSGGGMVEDIGGEIKDTG